jgi:dihydroxyacetone kinase-like protein
MKKLINAVDTILSESLDGFAAAHADIVSLGEGRKSPLSPPRARWR